MAVTTIEKQEPGTAIESSCRLVMYRSAGAISIAQIAEGSRTSTAKKRISTIGSVLHRSKTPYIVISWFLTK
jgi:hypothetical protein